MKNKLFLLIAVFFLQFSLVSNTYAASFGTISNEVSTQLSPEVKHIKRNYSASSVNRVVNILDVQLTSPYSSIEIGLNSPINKLAKTSTIAKNSNYEGHRVVGAINAAYFNGDGYPSTLIAKNNEIINFGAGGTDTESPTQNPVAFGIDRNGKAIAGYYKTNITYTTNGKTYGISSVNDTRDADKAVIYSEKNNSTKTNEWGREIVVENASQSTKKLGFGDVVTGTVKEVTQYGVTGNSTVPTNGFVISAHGTAITEAFDTLKPGDSITINVGIEDKWQDAQFILAAGPLLVDNGQVNISMPTSSSFAASRHPRSAIAIDATGTRVFLVTVDGRQTGVSVGSNLKDLAEYLISLGAKYAINLDGGGSTTMVTRNIETNSLNVVNVPSDSVERSVSATLQVINTAPQGQAKAIVLKENSVQLQAGETFTPTIKYAYDEYFNPLTVDLQNVQWTVEGNIGYMNGTQFIATNGGNGKLIGHYLGKDFAIQIDVKEMLPIQAFNDLSSYKVGPLNNISSININSYYTRSGKGSTALAFDFTASKVGEQKVTFNFVKELAINVTPKKMGLWVFNNQAPITMYATIRDSHGKKVEQKLTTTSSQWSGWRYLTGQWPSELSAPFAIESITMKAEGATKGTIYIDQLQAHYSDTYDELLYKDVALDDWAYTFIRDLNERKLITGYEDGSFKPTNSITRADVALIIARYMDKPTTKETKFKDVDSSHYAYTAIQQVAAEKIMTGRTENEFNPSSTLTRAEMATIVARMYSLTTAAPNTFKDLDASHWAYTAILQLAKAGYMTGYPDGTVLPDRSITRAEFASIFSKTLK